MAIIHFSPSPLSPFQFNATLDGQQYVVIVTWNIFGQRWYLNIYTTNGDLVLSKANIGSRNTDINQIQGYFSTSALVYRTASGNFEINP